MNLRHEYGYLREFWREGFRRDAAVCAVSFALATLLGFGVGLAVPEFREAMVAFFQEVMERSGMSELSDLSMTALLSNNLIATLEMGFMGAIPFLYLPVLALGVNAALLGATAAIYQVDGLPLGLFLTALLPHGVFELPALVLAGAAAIHLCREVGKICRKRSVRPFGHVAADCLRVYALTVIPLLVIAAAVEAWITPWLVGLLYSI